jgi:hypothetical protein
MIPRAHQRLTAWLGIFAMCLVVLVPLVSQLAMAAHAGEPNAALCSAFDSSGDHTPSHASHGDPLAACSYCDLLADHIAMPAVPPVMPLLVLLVAIAAAPVLSTRFTPLGAFPSGRPRAPPVLLASSL